MELAEAIRGRRAIRKYRNRPISQSLIQELVQLARYAPSSMNGQPWHFIVVRKEETKRQLVKLKNKYCAPEKRGYPADFLQHAAVIIVVGVEKDRSYGRDIHNAVIATAYLILGAYGKGLGSVFMTSESAEEPGLAKDIRHLLNIPETIDPITLIPLGYPDETPEPKTLRPIEEVIHYETFRAVNRSTD